MQTETLHSSAGCRYLWPVLLCANIAACTTAPPAAPVEPPAAPPPPAAPATAPEAVVQSVVPPVVLPAATRHALIAALAYRQGLQSMSASEMNRERNQLTTIAGNTVENQMPENKMRLALLYAQTRTPAGDPAKALALAEALLKSSDPAAVALHPLAALLVEQLTERVRLEGQHERQLAQHKENQRRIHDLQEKLERLANIERSLPARTPPPGKLP